VKAMLDKTPPHSIEAEKAVLGGIIRTSDAYKKAQAIVSPKDFYLEAHRTIFDAMGELHEKASPIDLITLQEAIGQDGHLEAVGGAVYLSQLLDATPTAGHIRHHAKIVKEKSDRRKLLRVAYEAETQVYEENKPAQEIGHSFWRK